MAKYTYNKRGNIAVSSIETDFLHATLDVVNDLKQKKELTLVN